MNATTIDNEGVGGIRLDQPLPASLLPADAEARYTARYVADGQPLEGVRLDAPPALIAISGGPFAREVEEKGMVEPTPEPYRGAAVKALREGAKVRMILVQGPGPATAAGVGVGSTLQALRAAYADLKLLAVPPTLGGDECVGTSAALANVRFLFSSCKDAESGGAITRIDITR